MGCDVHAEQVVPPAGCRFKGVLSAQERETGLGEKQCRERGTGQNKKSSSLAGAVAYLRHLGVEPFDRVKDLLERCGKPRNHRYAVMFEVTRGLLDRGCNPIVVTEAS